MILKWVYNHLLGQVDDKIDEYKKSITNYDRGVLSELRRELKGMLFNKFTIALGLIAIGGIFYYWRNRLMNLKGYSFVGEDGE